MDRSHGNSELLCYCPIGESFIMQTSDLFRVKLDSMTKPDDIVYGAQLNHWNLLGLKF